MDKEFQEENIEFYILKYLIENDTFARTFISKMEPGLFSANFIDIAQGIIVYNKKTGKFPPITILSDVVLPQLCRKDNDRLERNKEVLQTLEAIKIPVKDIQEFMYLETKKFIKTRTILKAFMKCMPMLQDYKHDEIVSTMETAFKLNFDESLGLDYFEDLELRMARAELEDEVISTGLPALDKLVGGGYRRKSMFIFAGPANVGKSLVLNDAATSLCFNGFNVIYLTLELAEDYISQRTDAKFAEIPMNVINAKPADAIKKAIVKRDLNKQQGKKMGKLMYKEYGPNEVSCNEIQALLQTLDTAKGFKPDFIIIDYINLLKPNGKVFGDNTYNKVKTITEEAKGLGVRNNACILSAAQTGRQSYDSASIGMQDVSDSIGIPQTADVFITLARNKALNDSDSMLMSLAKSRFSRNEGTIQVKIDYDYMKLIDPGDDASTIVSMRTDTISPTAVPGHKKKPEKSEKSENDKEMTLEI